VRKFKTLQCAESAAYAVLVRPL